MKTFVCIVLLAASALAAPAPEEGKREKRGFAHGLGFSSYSLDGPIISHSPIISHPPIISHSPIISYSAPATVIHEPAIVSVKKIVSVPEVVTVRKYVSSPLVSHYVSAPRVRYSSGWW